MKQKLAELKIPPLLILFTMVIIMTIGALSTLVVQAFLENLELREQLQLMQAPSAAPSVSSKIIVENITNTSILNTDSTMPEGTLTGEGFGNLGDKIESTAQSMEGAKERLRDHKLNERKRWLR